MPSFDFISEVSIQEVENAVNQSNKEIAGRFDFRGSPSKIEWDKKEITLHTDDDMKMKAMKDILQSKLHKRGVDISSVNFAKVEEMGGRMLRMKATIVQGIEKEKAKKIVALIKDAKLKVQAQIQEDKVRVTSKSLDDLQSCFQFVLGQNVGVPLQMGNRRS